MNKLAVRYDAHGPSRLPRPFGHVIRSDIDSLGTMQNGQATGKPSRLQQLQSDYQKQLLKEKESRLIEMYEQNQQRALNKVGRNKGMVRDFFNERRNNTGGSPNNNMSPTIEHMYKRKQIEHKQISTPPRQTFGYTGTHYTSQGPNQNIPAPSSNYQNSAGRDRSRPLAPIQRGGKNQNPFPKKAQIVRPKTLREVSNDKENLANKEIMPRSAPTGVFGMDNDSASDDSPLPNAKQLEALQQKRKLLQSRKSNKSIGSVQSNAGKPSDFQTWQMEQDSEREKRLQRHREKNGMVQHATDDEGYGEDDADGLSKEDMRRKQAELMAQIEAQQRELDRIRKERMDEEINEKKELERRRKIEEERKRRQAEEEKRKRKLEEEERLQREQEEEVARRKQAERKRLRQNSERSKYEYEESEQEEESRYYRKEPSPPPMPKPANVPTRRHNVPAKTTVTQRQPQPPPAGGAHTAMYEDAVRMEGAIESVGSLRACYNCGRKFAEDRIQKHEAACKNATKKRKVMDPTKLRTRGTEMEQFVNHKSKSDPKVELNLLKLKSD